MNELEFQNILKEKGIEVSEHQLQQFQKYYEILVEWNEKMNLTAITDKEDVYLKHFYDSITIAFDFDFNNQTLRSWCWFSLSSFKNPLSKFKDYNR